MKMRKWVAASIVGGCLFMFAQSAFAADNWADTMEMAKALQTHEFESSYIATQNDVDWFKWTNDTGNPVDADIYLFSPYGENYDLIMADRSPLGGYNYYIAKDMGDGGATDMLQKVHVAAGDTILWKIAPHSAGDYSATRNYFTWVLLE